MPATKPEASSDLPKLAAPAMRALKGAALTSLAKLARHGNEVMVLHGMGPNALKTLRAAMKARGIGFAKR